MNHSPKTRNAPLPLRAGVGLKAEHYGQILDEQPDIGWFEVHPENYMGDGGPPHHYLSRIRERYPISMHGVGLSIGGSEPPCQMHLDRLKNLMARYEPESFSEHLAWSSHEAGYFNDLLPLPYTEETLALVVEHIDLIQDRLGRRILLENPSHYLAFDNQQMNEIEFLIEIVARTGCGLLLDINNVYVSCTNQRTKAQDYLDQFPLNEVGEIHLAGHAEQQDESGERLLIDAHDRAVRDEVWHLFQSVINRGGRKPTLIEWDNNIPSWDILFYEAVAAEQILVTADRTYPEDQQSEVPQMSLAGGL